MPAEAAESYKQSFNCHATAGNAELAEHGADHQRPEEACIPFAASVTSAALPRRCAYAMLLSRGNLLNRHLSSALMSLLLRTPARVCQGSQQKQLVWRY